MIEVLKGGGVSKKIIAGLNADLNAEVIIGIQSANRNLENRQAVRASYAKNGNIAYKFLLDRSNPELEVENSVYNDIQSEGTLDN